jgi:outer membrane protein assembly factor BamB
MYPRRFGAMFVLVLCLASACSKKKPTEPVVTYTLTVRIAEGVEGTPRAGSYTYSQGDSIKYNYQLLPDFSDLAITLDGLAMASQGAFVMGKDHELMAACGRRILWKYLTPHSVYYASAAAGDDGTIYFGTGLYTTDQGWSPGTLYAMNRDGTLKWSRNIGEAVYSPAIGPDGNIYVMDRTYTVRAFSPGGGVLWTFNDFDNSQFVKRDMGQRTPAIGNDGKIYIGADGVYALNAASGAELWHVPHRRFPSRECIASPVIASDGTIYCVVGQDSLYAIKPDGSLKWAFGFAHDYEMSFSDPSIDADGTVYISSETHDTAYLHAVNTDGTLKWKFHVDGDRAVRGSVTIGPDGTLYMDTKAGADRTARLIAVSPSGQKLWHYVIEGRHVTGDDSYSTPSIGADGLIYFGAETGFLYALKQDGTLAWKHEVASGVNWSSPAILADGTLLIGGMGYGPNYTGQFCAVMTGSRGYAASPWPRFRCDRRNSGRAGGR